MSVDFNYADSIVVVSELPNLGQSHDSQEVTVTDTMRQGSLLKADGTEATKAEAAQVVGAIDDQEFVYKMRGGEDAIKTGDQPTVAVAKRFVVFNESALYYKGGEKIDAAGKTALAGQTNKFTVLADSTDVK